MQLPLSSPRRYIYDSGATLVYARRYKELNELSEYMRVAFDTKALKLKEPKINLYPLVCMHFGARQCDIKFIRDHVKRIAADPAGYYVYLGDAGECVTKNSKGDIYQQLLSPEEQVDLAVETLKPLEGRGLFGIRGNHGHRVFKETGLSFDKNLCHRLNIPYLGYAGFVNILVNKSSYDTFWHHGTDSGTPLVTKIRAAERFTNFIDADALFTAHSHIAMELQPALIQGFDNSHRQIRTKLRHQYICGCGYDSRSGYAAEKGYSPIIPAYVKVALDGRIIEGQPQKTQNCQIYRSDGQHKLEHDYLNAKDDKT